MNNNKLGILFFMLLIMFLVYLDESGKLQKIKDLLKGGTSVNSNTKSGVTTNASLEKHVTFPGAVEHWRATVNQMTQGLAVPPQLVLAVINQESSGNPTAISPKDANGGRGYGLMQLQTYGVGSGMSVASMLDPLTNLHHGITALNQLYIQYNGDIAKTLEAYNGGASHVNNDTVSDAAETYAQKIKKWFGL